MATSTRRDFLKAATGLATGVALSGRGAIAPSHAAGDDSTITAEKGAKLRVLRWKPSVQAEEDQWLANTKKFSEKTGVEVQVRSENYEEVRPKAAVVANEGRGPDIILGFFDDPHLYPDKLVDVSDVANFLEKKYGGWYDICRKYGSRNGAWFALPLAVLPNAMVYRESLIRAAGFDSFPKDTAGFLKLCQALKARNTPPGFSFGHALGNANNWCHWLLWSHGGRLVDDENNVVVNSKEVLAALTYARELYSTFIPGTLSWDDTTNDKLFLEGKISLTENAVSLYDAAKTSSDPRMKELANDIQHAHFPIGPAGKPTELMTLTQMMLFKHSKYPNAAKAYMQFMMEKDQFYSWVQAALGYVGQPLKAYEAHPLWTSDPKHIVYRDAAKRMLDNGYSGKLGYPSATAMADYIVVDMFAEAASGAKSPQAAAERAEKRALRYYKI